MKNLTRKYLINGPNNAFRLYNGEKIIYIFSDFHHNIQYQKECIYDNEYESIDFDQLLFKFIKYEKNKQYDIFIEWKDIYTKNKLQSPINNTNNKINKYRDNYILQLIKLILSKIKIINNKILTIKPYSNIRFHFFDIRDFIIYFNNIYKYLNIYNEYYYYPPYDIIILIAYIDKHKKLLEDIKQFKEYLSSSDCIFINKITKIYSNIDIKKIILKIIEDIIIVNIDNILNNTNNIINLLETSIITLKNNTISYQESLEIYKSIFIKLSNNLIIIGAIFSCITDIYCIRRITDKNYINNIIIYTGSAHAMNFIYIFTKYFNYKLTHLYYKHKKFNIDEIPKLSSNNFIYYHILSRNLECKDEDKTISQCIDLFNFPLNFT